MSEFLPSSGILRVDSCVHQFGPIAVLSSNGFSLAWSWGSKYRDGVRVAISSTTIPLNRFLQSKLASSFMGLKYVASLVSTFFYAHAFFLQDSSALTIGTIHSAPCLSRDLPVWVSHTVASSIMTVV